MKDLQRFQSSFELTGYITYLNSLFIDTANFVSKLFRAYGLYNRSTLSHFEALYVFQSSFELTGYITRTTPNVPTDPSEFQSSFELTGYITAAA